MQLIDKQIREAKDGQPDDLAAWKNQTEVVLRTIFGVGHPTYDSFLRIRYSSQVFSPDMPSEKAGFRAKGVRAAIALLGERNLNFNSLEKPYK